MCPEPDIDVEHAVAQMESEGPAQSAPPPAPTYQPRQVVVMPAYRSHKIVHALLITDITYAAGEDNRALLLVAAPEGDTNTYGPISVNPEYLRRHRPEVGGYYVRYHDGYESWSPRQVFEEGYTRYPQLEDRPEATPVHAPPFDTLGQDTPSPAQPVVRDIGWAIRQLHFAYVKVRRAGWNGKGMSLGLQMPDANSANTLPYIYMITVTGDRVPWLCSQTDLLATDWEIAAEATA